MINDCQECEDFDLKTKELVGQFLSQDEVCLLANLLVSRIQYEKIQMAKPTTTKKMRFQILALISFMNQTVGKMRIAMNPQYLENMDKECEKNKITLNIKHESCPHKEKTLASVPAPA